MARVLDLCPELVRAPCPHPGWRWFVHGERGAAIAHACAPYLDADAALAPGTVEVVDNKRTRQLAFVRSTGETVFAKRFTPDLGGQLRETLRLRGPWLGRKGAVTEAAHALLAARRFGRTPELFALAERTRAGLVAEQVLLFEALTDHDDLGHLLAGEVAQPEPPMQAAPQTTLDALTRAFDLLLALDRSGLAHLDAHPGNVMLSRNDPADDRVIDLEQLVEVQPGRPEILGFVIGFLGWPDPPGQLTREAYDVPALDALSRAFGGRRPPDLALLAYRHFQKKPLHRRRRLALARRGLSALGATRAALMQRSADKVWNARNR